MKVLEMLEIVIMEMQRVYIGLCGLLLTCLIMDYMAEGFGRMVNFVANKVNTLRQAKSI